MSGFSSFVDYTFSLPDGGKVTQRYVRVPEGLTLVAVSPEVARLIEAVGADNLPALLRVAWVAGPFYDDGRSFPRKLADQDAACNAVDDDTWERLGEALDGGA